MVVVLLGFLGFVVGYASTWLGGHQYYVASTLFLPRHSQPWPSELVAMTAGRHPGSVIHVDGARNRVSVIATGSILGADKAVREGVQALVFANYGKFKFLAFDHWVDQKGLAWGDPVRRGTLGLLAGLSAAVGFLVPPRSRLI